MGTLACLSPTEQSIIKGNYKIIEHTLAPSLYGISKISFVKQSLEFKKDTDVNVFEDEDRYHQAIKKEIQDAQVRNASTVFNF